MKIKAVLRERALCVSCIFLLVPCTLTIEDVFRVGMGAGAESSGHSGFKSLKKSLGDFCGYFQGVRRFVS